MNHAKARLFIVDDEPAVRMTMSAALTEIGYQVRSAADGMAALAEIHREAPEILISDLNMPGMSGFELLPAVRKRFPRIQIVVMSGQFSAGKTPLGVTADAFYPKGEGMVHLTGILESLTLQGRIDPKPPVVLPPIRVASHWRNQSGEAYVTIECPECLKSFPLVLDHLIGSMSETDCAFCGCLIRYAITRPEDQTC